MCSMVAAGLSIRCGDELTNEKAPRRDVEPDSLKLDHDTGCVSERLSHVHGCRVVRAVQDEHARHWSKYAARP